MQIISAEKIFTGNQWLTNYSIVLDHGKIKELVLQSEIDLSNTSLFPDAFIVPAFIDVQVYGASKKLLAVYPEAETLRLMHEAFVNQGTCLFVPTLATNKIDVFRKAIDAVRDYWNKAGEGVFGLHLEGPWLNESKSGAHVKQWIHSPSVDEAKSLLEYGKGVVKMITIAPEVCSDEVIELILSHDIVLSAGHSNATYNKAVKGFDKGITTATHLYNAMSPLYHRDPGLVGAVFNHRLVKASIIPDGHHVNYSAIAIAKKIMGDRLFAITDGVTETHDGPYQHQLAGDKYECNGVLSGSALSMHKAFRNLVDYAGIDIDEALRMCSLYPAQVLRCDNRYGKIAPGYEGQLLVMNRQFDIQEVITS